MAHKTTTAIRAVQITHTQSVPSAKILIFLRVLLKERPHQTDLSVKFRQTAHFWSVHITFFFWCAMCGAFAQTKAVLGAGWEDIIFNIGHTGYVGFMAQNTSLLSPPFEFISNFWVNFFSPGAIHKERSRSVFFSLSCKVLLLMLS